MAKITQEQRSKYAARVKEFTDKIEKLQDDEQHLLATLKDATSQDAGYMRIKLAEHALVITSYYILLNSLSVAMINIKNEDALAEARKTVGRTIKYIEDTVTPYLDVSYSEYESSLANIANIPCEVKYNLLHRIGFAISEIEEAYGATSKWKWIFVELWGKMAIITKNSLDLKKAYKDLDLTSQDRAITMSYLAFIKKMLQSSADRYREKYEVFSTRIEDFKQAILFLSALRRLHTVFGERDDAEDLKKKIEIWTKKLEVDQKKREEEGKKY